MKPTSIIFLIVSAVTIVLGLTLCLIAGNLATANGVQLFPEYKDGTSIRTDDISTKEISMFSVSAEDATVNIYGGCASSYVEIINFKENYYSYSSNNKTVTFDETPDLMSMLKFWENGFSFNGMRNILIHKNVELGEKVINIYLKDSELLKQINITLTNGELNLNNLSYGCSYSISVDSGNVNFNAVTTSDIVSVKSKDCNFTFKDSNVKTLTFESKKAVIEMNTSKFVTSTVTFESGSVNVVSSTTRTSVVATTETGEITVSGENKGTAYSLQDAIYDRSLKINTKSASINIE